MTPTRTNLGVSSLKRCLRSRRLTRWSAKCAATSNGISMSAERRLSRLSRTSEQNSVPEQSPTRADQTNLPVLPHRPLLPLTTCRSRFTTSTLHPRRRRTFLDPFDLCLRHTSTNRTRNIPPSHPPPVCLHPQPRLNTSHLISLRQRLRRFNLHQRATTARRHHPLLSVHRLITPEYQARVASMTKCLVTSLLAVSDVNIIRT